jgi:hypothetical protein
MREMVGLIFLWEPYEGVFPKLRELVGFSGMLEVHMERGWKHISSMHGRHKHLLHQPGLTLEILLVGFLHPDDGGFEVMGSLVSPSTL